MSTLNPPVASYAPSSPAIKPLPFRPAVLFFAIPALAFVIAVYWGIPAFVELGMTEFSAYMVGLLIPLVASFIAALIGYGLEGRPMTLSAFSERFRLQRMTRSDWLWSLGGFVVAFVGNFAFAELLKILISDNLVPLPNYIPAALHPAMRIDLAAYGELMGPRAVGNWGLIALVAVVMFFNTIGEEFWWRGYILPRQELAHGRKTWRIHCAMWTLFHVFEYWRWLDILAVTLPISYISSRQRSTWPGIIIHGLINFISVFELGFIVFGLVP